MSDSTDPPPTARPDDLATLHATLSGHVDRIVETFAANEDDHTVFLTRDSLSKGAKFWDDTHGARGETPQHILGTWETVPEPLRLPSIAIPEMDPDNPMARRQQHRGGQSTAHGIPKQQQGEQQQHHDDASCNAPSSFSLPAVAPTTPQLPPIPPPIPTNTTPETRTLHAQPTHHSSIAPPPLGTNQISKKPPTSSVNTKENSLTNVIQQPTRRRPVARALVGPPCAGNAPSHTPPLHTPPLHTHPSHTPFSGWYDSSEESDAVASMGNRVAATVHHDVDHHPNLDHDEGMDGNDQHNTSGTHRGTPASTTAPLSRHPDTSHYHGTPAGPGPPVCSPPQHVGAMLQVKAGAWHCSQGPSKEEARKRTPVGPPVGSPVGAQGPPLVPQETGTQRDPQSSIHRETGAPPEGPRSLLQSPAGTTQVTKKSREIQGEAMTMLYHTTPAHEPAATPEQQRHASCMQNPRSVGMDTPPSVVEDWWRLLQVMFLAACFAVSLVIMGAVSTSAAVVAWAHCVWVQGVGRREGGVRRVGWVGGVVGSAAVLCVAQVMARMGVLFKS